MTSTDATESTADEAAARPKPGRPVTQPCGTVAAYKRHRRHGEEACKACKQEWAAANRHMYANRKATT